MPVKKDTKAKVIYFSPGEWQEVCKRSAALGMRTGTYIRTIAVRGNISHFDMKQFAHLIMAFNSIGAELNQIARVVNSTKSVFQKDVEDMRERFKELDVVFRNYLLPIRTGELEEDG